MISPFRLCRHRPGKAAETTAPDALFVDLARARDGAPWNAEDRRRDFRRVFLGSEAGKRVLHELFSWSHMFASTFVPGDAYATHWREGGRDVGLRLLAVVNSAEPDGDDGEGEAS